MNYGKYIHTYYRSPRLVDQPLITKWCLEKPSNSWSKCFPNELNKPLHMCELGYLSSQIHSPWIGYIVDSGIGCRTVLPVYVAWRARTLCRSQLYPSVRDLKFSLRTQLCLLQLFYTKSEKSDFRKLFFFWKNSTRLTWVSNESERKVCCKTANIHSKENSKHIFPKSQ